MLENSNQCPAVARGVEMLRLPMARALISLKLEEN